MTTNSIHNGDFDNLNGYARPTTSEEDEFAAEFEAMDAAASAELEANADSAGTDVNAIAAESGTGAALGFNWQTAVLVAGTAILVGAVTVYITRRLSSSTTARSRRELKALFGAIGDKELGEYVRLVPFFATGTIELTDAAKGLPEDRSFTQKATFDKTLTRKDVQARAEKALAVFNRLKACEAGDRADVEDIQKKVQAEIGYHSLRLPLYELLAVQDDKGASDMAQKVYAEFTAAQLDFVAGEMTRLLEIASDPEKMGRYLAAKAARSAQPTAPTTAQVKQAAWAAAQATAPQPAPAVQPPAPTQPAAANGAHPTPEAFSNLPWNEMQSAAANLGVPTKGVKKPELIAAYQAAYASA